MCLQDALDFCWIFMISRLISLLISSDFSWFPLISGESVRDFFRCGPLGSFHSMGLAIRSCGHFWLNYDPDTIAKSIPEASVCYWKCLCGIQSGSKNMAFPFLVEANWSHHSTLSRISLVIWTWWSRCCTEWATSRKCLRNNVSCWYNFTCKWQLVYWIIIFS